MSLETINQQIVAKFWEAFSCGEYETALSLLDDREFTWWILGSPKQFCLAGSRDKSAFKELLTGVSANTKDGIRMIPSAWTVQGERVAMEAESHATMANGKVYNNLYHFLIIVRDGKIRMVKEFLDTQHAAEVLCG